MSTVDFRVCEFGARSPDALQVEDLASLHEALLEHSPLVLMGPDFLRDFYYSLLPADGFICGAIAYIDDDPAGFIVATGDANGFMGKAAKRHWLRLIWILMGTIIKRPSSILAIKEAHEVQSNVKAGDYGPDVGEMLSFGVLPEYRSRKFIGKTGISVASDLLEAAVSQLRADGKRKLRAIVDKDNLEAQFFYRANGWHVGLKSVEGWRVPTMEFLRELE